MSMPVAALEGGVLGQISALHLCVETVFLLLLLFFLAFFELALSSIAVELDFWF